MQLALDNLSEKGITKDTISERSKDIQQKRRYYFTLFY